MIHRSLLFNFSIRRITVIFAGVSLLLAHPCAAQVLPDSSLGTESSIITPEIDPSSQGIELITGGAQRGTNLFHSFQEFSINDLQRIYFDNPAGIENILSRVTGSTPSTILGTLGVLGEANLFLLNPNGIVFGPNAQIDISGSFLASTANHFQFSDGSEFGTTNLQLPALTITAPLGLQYGQGQAPIELAGSLSVSEGNDLTLIGSDIRSQGGLLTAPGGRVEVLGDRIALFGQTVIDVSSPIGGGSIFLGSSSQGGDFLFDASQVYVAPTVKINANAVTAGNGGSVLVWADDANRFHGSITAQGGSERGDGGFIKVGTEGTLIFQGIADSTASLGQTGTFLLVAPNIIVNPGSLQHSPTDIDSINNLDNNAISQGVEAGLISDLLESNHLDIRASNAISFESGSNITANSPNTLKLHAHSVKLSDAILAQTGGGNIIIDTTQGPEDPKNPRESLVTANNSIISTDVNTRGASIITGSGIVNIDVVPDISEKILQGGDVQIITDNLLFTNGARISANTGGEGNAGNIDITVVETAVFDGFSLGKNRNSGVFSFIQNGINSQGGNIYLTAKNLYVTNGAQLFTGIASGTGIAGNLKLNVAETSTFDGMANLAFPVLSGALSSIGKDGSGKGGNLDLETHTLNVTNGAQLGTGLLGGRGESGNMNFTIRGTATFDGSTPDGEFPSGAFSSVEPGSSGSGGNLELTAEALSVTNGAILSASTFGIGNAGKVKLTISKTATFDGVPPASRFSTGAYSSVEEGGVGQGGNLEISADALIVSNGAVLSARSLGIGKAGSISLNVNSFSASTGGQVQASTFTSGPAGDIVIAANQKISLTDPGTGIFANTAPGSSGNSGNIILESQAILVEDEARIAVDSQGKGSGGNINVQAKRLELNHRGAITAETASNQGGNITLEVEDLLLLRQGSFISTTAGNFQAGGDGGNIAIQTPFVLGVLEENSDITANAFRGRGGNIDIAAYGIYGLEIQLQQTPSSDITASSQLGISGTVTIESLNLDPIQGIVVLPTDFFTSDQLITTTCAADQDNSFAMTGRGGIPEDPRQPLVGRVLWHDERPRDPKERSLMPLELTPSSDLPLVEAQNWIIDREGKVTLVTTQVDARRRTALQRRGCAVSQVSPQALSD